MNGIINFLKPRNMTSHDAVNYFRKLLGIKRIGHTGTLDPQVSGVLPVCIGKATRVSQYILDADKEYIGELTLGKKTSTQDGSGEIIKTSNKEVTNQEIINIFNNYIGPIEQTPPMYSAVRYKGKRLYELAREGKSVDRKKRNAIIYSLDIVNIKANKVLFKVKCSKGTYIRTLCNDIGEDLGTYGYMSFLMRTSVGDFKISDSLSMDFLNGLNKNDIKNYILPTDIGLSASNLEDLIIPKEDLIRAKNGAIVYLKGESFLYDTLLKVYTNDNIFIGLGKVYKNNKRDILKMKKVFI